VSNTLENIPTLQLLCIKGYGQYKYTLPIGPRFLSELRITLQCFNIDNARLISSYSQLTKLHLSTPSVRGLGTINEDITLPSLLSLSCDNLSALQHFITPSLAELDIQGYEEDDIDIERNSIFCKFLERCTNGLRSFTIETKVGDTFLAQILPLLSVQPGLWKLCIHHWPLGLSSHVLSSSRERPWCPNLCELTVSIQDEDASRSQQMEELAQFLRSRKEIGLGKMKRLTVRKPIDMDDFPHETFINVPVDKMCVMVPL
jgi:hypothetical protein